MKAPQPPRDPGRDQVCPVCLWPDHASAVCDRCGCELVGDYMLGPATQAEERDLATRLAERQRDYDLCAAVRAAGVSGERDPARLARLAGLARGGSPQPGQIERAAAEVDAAEPPPAGTSAGIVFALTRLVAGKTDAIAFVEMGPDTVSVQTLITDQLGVPVRLVGDSLPWTAILPLLPGDTDLRHLRMAGGIGVGPDGDADPAPGPAVLIDAVDDAIMPVLARLAAAASAAAVMSRTGRPPGDSGSSPHRAAHRLDTVLVRRTHRWPVLDAAVARARSVMRPVAEIVALPGSGGLAGIVDHASASAPLKYGYDLVLVEVDERTGKVRPRSRELFAPGAAALPGRRAAKPVPLAAVRGHGAKRLALPIVARRGPVSDFRDVAALKDRRPLVQMAAIDGEAAGTTMLHVRLSKPGRLKMRATPDLLATDPGVGWPELIGELPEAIPPTDVPGESGVDLVLLVELGGDSDVVAARIELARQIVEALPDVAAAQVAVVGYRDHFGKHYVDAIAVRGKEHEALIVGCGLSPATGVLSMLKRSVLQRSDRWKAVPTGDDHAAPIEDALLVVADSHWGWRPQARHVLFLIGRRPPHPARAGPYGDAMLPCPYRYSWQDALGRLRDEQALECFTVLERSASSRHAESVWNELGAQGSFPAGSSTGEQLAQAAGLVPRAGAVPLCLARYAAGNSVRSHGGKAGS